LYFILNKEALQMTDDKEKKQDDVKLKVAEANQEDVNKGIIRMDIKAMKEIGVRPGSVVEIIGERSSVAIVDRAYPRDLGLDIIRMDGLTRSNAKTSIGELVRIKKADFKEAKRIKIAPIQQNVVVRITGSPNAVKKSLLGRAILKGDIISLGGARSRRNAFSGSPFEDIFRMLEEDLSVAPYGMGDMKWVVVSTNPLDKPVVITDMTEVEVSPQAVKVEEKKIPDVTYEDIGGLDQEIEKIREMVELPLKHPELFDRLGIGAPKGVLLYGPPGTGKTLLAKAVANESSAYFISIAGPEIMSKWVGEAEKKLREIFEDAEKNAPSIIFIDELDAIAPKREEVVGEVERRVVAQLLNSMDGLKSRGKVVVIGATNRPNAIDPALRRPGRFDREIEIGVPDVKGRLEILKIHTRNMPLTKDVDLKSLSQTTYGFVGADLEELCKEAAMHSLRIVLPELNIKEGEPLSQESLNKIIVTKKDFREGLKMVSPSAMREVLIEIPKVKWEEVGGLEGVKQKLKESVEWPLKRPDAFRKMGITPPKGVLLYGPPGCGKTLLAKAVANESEANFISVKGPEIFSKWVGESEKAIREIFRRARQVAPSIIFFDEIDSVVPRRGMDAGSHVSEKVVNQILTELDGLEALNDVIVIAATNRPDIMDSSLLRPGRFDRLIFVPPPDEKARTKIFEVHTKGMPIDKDVNLNKLAKSTEGYSGADINGICREAAMITLREDKNAKKISAKFFSKALEEVAPSLRKEDVELYKMFETAVKSKASSKPKELSKELNYLG